MWIYLKNKLPTNPSPPKLSIHWATPWGDSSPAIAQQAELERVEDDIMVYGEDFRIIEKIDDAYIRYNPLAMFGYEHDEINAVGINYKGERLKLFPNEFNIVKPENMKLYIFGDSNFPDEDSASHHLVPSSEVDTLLLKTAEETALRHVKEAAMLDGCNEAQALALLMGMDIESAIAEFPPVGWYRCRVEYACMFADEWELEE